MPHRLFRFASLACSLILLAACHGLGGHPDATPTVPPVPFKPVPPRIGLVLGGGAARGFAHVGVIKMLESQGITPDLVVGTSAGAVVGSLYASGLSGFELQEMSLDLDKAQFSDWHLFGHGLVRGVALQEFIDRSVGGVPIEKLKIPFACVATRLRTGEAVLFTKGDTGLAVRASSAIPGVFESPVIDGDSYVDGGAVSPVPVRFAQALGAEVVIAVMISASVEDQSDDSSLRALLKTFNIMGHALSAAELPLADVVIAPDVRAIGSADFEDKQRAELEGERAALAAMPQIRAAIAAKTHLVP